MNWSSLAWTEHQKEEGWDVGKEMEIKMREVMTHSNKTKTKKPFGTEAYALTPAAKSNILRAYSLSRITSFKHGWWFWTVALKKPSIWQFYHHTFTKAYHCLNLFGDLTLGRTKKIVHEVVFWSGLFNINDSRSLFQSILRPSSKRGKCKTDQFLSFLETACISATTIAAGKCTQGCF